MNIAHFETSMNWGGQELRIVEQIEWLLKNGHNAWLIARPGSAILMEAEKRGLPCFSLRVRGSLNPSTLRALFGFLKLNEVSVLDCHGNRDATYGLLVKLFTKVRVIRSRHVTTPVKRGVLRDFVWKYGCDAIITTAKAINNHLVSSGLSSEEKVYAAIPGVDHHRFHSGIDSSQLKRQYGIPEDAFVLANVGMIRPDKGQNFFVEAINRLIQNGRSVYAIQVGDATSETQNYKQQLLDQLQSIDDPSRMQFLGYHHDIENYLAMADAVMVCSIKVEAQTRLVTQAFLMKKNVIATDVGGLPEMIAHEQTGLLCQPESSEQLAELAIQLIDQPELARSLRENAYLHAIKNMTFDRMMDEMLSIYSAAEED
jgi:glycosyltransferase involved in cell wall biosynthesis